MAGSLSWLEHGNHNPGVGGSSPSLATNFLFLAVPSLIDPGLGPVIGGFIVEYPHWRAIAFVKLPIGAAGLYQVFHHLPDCRTSRPDPLD